MKYKIHSERRRPFRHVWIQLPVLAIAIGLSVFAVIDRSPLLRGSITGFDLCKVGDRATLLVDGKSTRIYNFTFDFRSTAPYQRSAQEPVIVDATLKIAVNGSPLGAIKTRDLAIKGQKPGFNVYNSAGPGSINEISLTVFASSCDVNRTFLVNVRAKTVE